MTDQIVTNFDDDISQLHGLIAQMGGLAERSIDQAIAALAAQDVEMAASVIADGTKLGILESEVEKCAIQLIGQQAPMADNLPDVIAALKIAGAVERIGDHAIRIARRVPEIGVSKTRMAPLALIPTMAEIARSMVGDALTAYASNSVDGAAEVIKRDQRLDNFYDSLFRNLVSHMMENPATISSVAHLLFVARTLEWIGDQAKAVAEMVYFVATGRAFSKHEHSSPLKKV